ncbi:patched domain-containing protein 3-like [Centruroides vittatus]|uniref:patched domain-containing protein 3-like n=1 Tax=Centruroides vittatus TaxID=120091 RepID=UPI00350FFE53
MKKSLMNRYLSFCFSQIGYFVGKYPQHCAAASFLVFLIMGSGFVNYSIVRDVEYLFAPIDGRAKSDRESINTLFSSEETIADDLLRATSLNNSVNVIVVAKNNGFLTDDAPAKDLVQIDAIVRNVSIFYNNKFLRFRDVCVKNERNKCSENSVSALKNKLRNPDKILMRYPIQRSNVGIETYPIHFGGVSTNGSGYILNFKAFRMFYFMDFGTEEKARIAVKWEEAIIDTLSRVKFRHIDVMMATARSFDVEATGNSALSIPLMAISGPIMVLFSMASCMTFDIVSSKPLVGLAGLISPLVATAASFGLLLHCGMEYVDTNIAVAFLLIGIGMDDSFVLLASWRRTNKEDSVKKRMGETFSEAGVSISVTSFTNFACFCVGFVSPYKAVRIFCTYSAVSVLFDFIYQIFFFGALMALDGYREQHRLHSFLCYPVKRKDIENETSEMEKVKTESDKSDMAMKYLSEKLGNLLCIKIVKLVVIIGFCSIVAVSVYNMRDMKQGVEFVDAFPYSSYVTKFLNEHYRYYTDYPHPIQIVFNHSLDYSNSIVQGDVEKILQTFENAPYMGGSELSLCWIREYLSFIRNGEINYLMKDFNTSDSRGFLQGLKRVFLRIKPFSPFRKDLVWNKERNQILASRCFVMSKGVRSGSDEKFLLENVRRIADGSKHRIFVYNFWFVIYDQYLNVLAMCVQNVGVALGMLSLILLILIQDVRIVVCVALNVLCILIQTVGFMNCWKVKLDLVSVMILVMSAGFCVDFSAHVAYAYKCCQKETSEEKIKASLYAAGYPVIQGCLSTILGVVVLAFGPSYLFILFFKQILLVTVFAALNGLILLPVLLSIVDSVRVPWKKQIIVDSSFENRPI